MRLKVTGSWDQIFSWLSPPLTNRYKSKDPSRMVRRNNRSTFLTCLPSVQFQVLHHFEDTLWRRFDGNLFLATVTVQGNLKWCHHFQSHHLWCSIYTGASAENEKLFTVRFLEKMCLKLIVFPGPLHIAHL